MNDASDHKKRSLELEQHLHPGKKRPRIEAPTSAIDPLSTAFSTTTSTANLFLEKLPAELRDAVSALSTAWK